jgi:hypothetical protein
MVFRDGRLIIANHNAVLSYPYALGQTPCRQAREADGPARRRQPLGAQPAAQRRWRQALCDRRLLVEHRGERHRPGKGPRAIHEYDFAKHRSREFAGGLRNPNGLDWNPHSGELWTVVNERDMLGPIVPDYLTNVPLGAHTAGRGPTGRRTSTGA